MTTRIFLSYRREDAAAWAGRLHDSLATRFGERNISQDVVAVGPCEDFTAAIDRALEVADATLVVIGPTWLTVAGPDGSWTSDVLDGQQRDLDSGWTAVLVVEGTNGTSEVMYHEPFTYELVIDGIEFRPRCFSVIAGNPPISPNSRNRALVGFLPSIEPAAGDLELDVFFADQTERIDLDGDTE